MPRPRVRARLLAKAGRFDSSAKDAVIETLLSLLAAAALATAPGDSAVRPVRTLPPVEVDAERVRLDGRRRLPTASVTELRTGSANRAVESLGDLLTAVAGANVIQYGAMGSFSTLSLRGAPPGQVSVYLDGVPLTSAAHGVVDLSSIPAGALERVEVYRTLSPATFGAATPAGAVNLVSADAAAARQVRVAAGTFGTGEALGTFAGARGPWSLLAHAGGFATRGDFVYHNDNSTPFDLTDDRDLRRVNDRVDAADGLARLAWHPAPGVRAIGRIEGFRKAQGVPGRAGTPAPNPRLAFERLLGALELAFAPHAAAPGLAVRAHANGERSRFHDATGQLGLGWQDTDERFADRAIGLQLDSPRAWRRVTASAGASGRREHAAPAPPTAGQPAPPDSRRDTEGTYASVQVHLANDALIVHAARRWDREHDHVRATQVGGLPYASDGSRTLNSPQAGARLRLPRGLEARANWTRTSRAPEFLELFGDQGDVLGNPRLLPERAEGWDAGGAWHGRALGAGASLDWAHWETHERDLIAFWPAGLRSARAVNVARAELRGEDAAARLDWGAVALSGTSAWTSAIQTASPSIYHGRRLPQRPSRQRSARLDARRGPWALAAEVVAIGDDYLDPINFNRAPPRTLWGASISRALGRARLTLEGRNLGGERALDVAGYPLPGRSVYAALDLDLTDHPTPRIPETP